MSNRRHYRKFMKMNKPIAKKHANCTSDPLRLFPQDTPVISYVRFPQLHVFLHLNWYIDHMETRHSDVQLWYVAFVTEFVTLLNVCVRTL